MAFKLPKGVGWHTRYRWNWVPGPPSPEDAKQNDGILKEQVARELNIVAWSEDGIVEAVSMPRSKVLGLQWHPERQQERYDSYLVTELLGS